MMRVDNKRVVRELAGRDYRGDLLGNALVILAVALTTLLVTVVFVIGGSYYQSLKKRLVATEGIMADIQLPSPTEEQIEKARTLPEILYAGLRVECAAIEEFQGKAKDIHLFYSDRVCFEEQCIPAYAYFEGSYPEKEDEIALSERSLKALGIEEPEIGMELSLTVSQARGEETIQEGVFSLTGFYRDFTEEGSGYVSEALCQKSGVTSTDRWLGYLNVSLKNPIYTDAEISKLQQEIGLEPNQAFNYDMWIFPTFVQNLVSLGSLLLLLFSCGYLFIYNVLYLSINQDVRHFGQLKTIGMTNRQIQSYVKLRMLWNGTAGILLGLGLGILSSNVAVPGLMKYFTSASYRVELASANPLILLGAALFSGFTVWRGSAAPARIAGKLSPVAALGYQGGSLEKRGKKKREGRMRSTILGMAVDNLFRDRKQTGIILLSFVTALTAFLTVSVLVRGNDPKRSLNASYTYDSRATVSDAVALLRTDQNPEHFLNEEDIEKLKAIDGVKEVRPLYTEPIRMEYDKAVYDPYFQQLEETAAMAGYYVGYQENPEDGYYLDCRLIAIGEEELEANQDWIEGEFDKEDFLAGKTAILGSSIYASSDCLLIQPLQFTIPGQGGEDSHCIRATAKMKDAEAVRNTMTPYSPSMLPDLLVSESYLRSLVEEPLMEAITIRYEKPFDEEIDDAVREVFADKKSVSVDTKMDSYQEKKASEEEIRLLGNTLGVFLAALALLNFGNMMAVGISNRKREFATLKSIGMTGKQIRELLILEGAGYGTLAFALTVVVGIPISYFIFRGLSVWDHMPYQIPVLVNLAVLLLTYGFCILIPLALYGLGGKDSIVEELREE